MELQGDLSLKIPVCSVLEQIREELDDHRLAINETTTEVQAGYEEIQLLHDKIEKLHEKIEELTFLIKGTTEKQEFNINPLTGKEKEVFTAFYSLNEINDQVTYRQIARKLGTAEPLVSLYVNSMREKGVPIEKRFKGNVVFLKLEDKFRQEQAKNNILKINTLLTYWCK
ncbi:hypothetical protein HY837_06655 [archaeon]|nr:hypothetical protein [archaeon]